MPITSRSASKRWVHKLLDRITTKSLPGVASSSWNARPNEGCTSTTSKIAGEIWAPVTGRGSPFPTPPRMWDWRL